MFFQIFFFMIALFNVKKGDFYVDESGKFYKFIHPQ